MNLVSYALVTLDDTKSFLGYTNNSKDETTKLFINMATDFIEEYCNRRFKMTTYTDDKYDGTGEKNLLLKNYPVDTLTAIAENTQSDGNGSWVILDSDNYNVEVKTGIIEKKCSFNRGFQNYQIDYKAGFDDIPYDIQFACMSFVENLFRQRNAQGLESESLGDHRVVFLKAFQENDQYKKVLDKYKNINV